MVARPNRFGNEQCVKKSKEKSKEKSMETQSFQRLGA